MIAIVVRSARLLAAHWPALLAWILAGTLGHYLVLELASLVGARTALGGILLLPLAALCLVVAYVGMFLVLRRGMPTLRALAPLPDGPRERRRAFLDGVLGGILPFVAFYAAWGFIRDDVADYLNGVHTWLAAWGQNAAVNGLEFDTTGTGDQIGFDIVTATILVAAFVGRWAHKRWKSQLPLWTGVPATYLEVLWVYLAAYILTDLARAVTDWIASRQAMVWLADVRESMVGVLAPVGFVWDAVEWLLGEAGGLILLPVAWLTIAGVIYGQAVRATAPRLRGRVVEHVRTRYDTVPQRVRRRLRDIWLEVTGRFRPIGQAIALMWRAGPVLIAGYVLLYTIVTLGENWLIIGLSRAIGPHPTNTVWQPLSVALVMIVAAVVAPLRVVVIAGTYDRAIRAIASAGDDESEVEDLVVAADRDDDIEMLAEPAGQKDRVGDVVRDDRV
ncbi:MAG: hypothetical protein P0Y48_10250 [Candidatus Microbacterium phytovorans]|uniref:Uncharacterized protein n=1 Tax=Candidatus Microbacterium phytovorans TaxID=3121374 RepID=A0AAJ5W1J0_9MICO|nr:hypothetical protein [Microbacterium sp.]WEK12842.1 MAG: hypothetical protein P0Y48_10250 [Microbacterium sp.]